LTGVGFVFTQGDPMTGVDLDNCCNPETGEIHPAAQAIISELNSYTEVSPSGTGVKIFLKSSGSPGPRHRAKYDGGEIEVYSDGRYFTVTGAFLPDVSAAVERRDSELAKVYDRIFTGALALQGNTGVEPGIAPVAAETPDATVGAAEPDAVTAALLENLSDADLIDMARLARNGQKFSLLFFDGNTSYYGGDESRADLGLVNILAFWCRNDAARIDRLFRQSRLMRPKWDERHSGTGATYGQMTIQKAIEGPHDIYNPNHGCAEASAAAPENDARTPAPPSAGASPTSSPSSRPSQALVLIKLAEGFDYFHSPDDKGFVTFPVNGHRETHSVRSRTFKLYLQGLFYRERNNAISSKSLADAIGVLEAKAMYDGPEMTVFIRVGEVDGHIFVDGGSEDWSAYDISRNGWALSTAPPIKFVRPGGMRALPRPVPSADALNVFRRAMNLADASDLKLFVAWAHAALRPKGPYPLLSFRSAHGSGKTTASRVARALIDPNEVASRTPPRDEQDVFLAASHSWVVSFDNVSKISDAFSDALCRLSTGGGYGTRELYTNDEEYLFSAQRPVIINGVDDAIRRTDLLDRTIQIELPEISRENRLPEVEFWKRFDQLAPGVVAVLFDAAVEAMRNIGSIELASLPRMADFATWVEAGAPAFGWKPGDFLNIYGGNHKRLTEATIEASPAGRHILHLRDWRSEEWEGTATELLEALEERAEERDKRRAEWPRSARAMSNVLRHLLPSLREAGIVVNFDRGASASRERLIRLTATTPTQVGMFSKPEPQYPD
jgi:hypothetical protein